MDCISGLTGHTGECGCLCWALLQYGHLVHDALRCLTFVQVALGIPVPRLWAAIMGRAIGSGPAYNLLQEATLLSPQDALNLGLVDEVVSKDVLMSSAEEWMQKMLKLPDKGRQVTKLRMREELSKELEDKAEAEAETAWPFLQHPNTVRTLGGVLKKAV